MSALVTFLKVAVSAGFVGATGFGLYEYNTSPALRRNVVLWKELGPIITHYRMVEFKLKHLKMTEDDENDAYMELHDKYSSKVMGTLRDLRGFYIKVAQVMANRNDLMPEVYIEKLRALEDKVPHLLNGEQARSLLCDSLNIERVDDVFLNFSDLPIGSASIGQVHKATLKENGKTVAVKIQGPGSEELFRNDIGAAKNFCQVFAPEQVAIFDEIEKQFLTEFDYRAEAKNLETIKNNMKRFRDLVIPRPYLNLCTKEVLTMEFLEGPKLVDGAREKGREYAASIGKKFEDIEKDWKKDIAKNGLPPPYNGPSQFTLELYRQYLKVKDTAINAPAYLANQMISLFSFITRLELKPFSYHHSFVPLNSSRIISSLLKAHGHQLLVDGFFNADPHPGNFLLLPDGRIGMIDYGQVKKLSENERVTIARLVLAIANEDKDAVYKLNLETGYRSKHMNKEVMWKVNTVILDRDGRDVTDGLNLQQFIDKMYALDPWEETADFIVMPMRLSLLMRGCALMLNHPVSVCSAWKDIAEKAVSQFEKKTKSFKC